MNLFLPVLFPLVVLVTGCGRTPPPPPADQPLTVHVHVSTNEIRIGELVEVALDVTHPAQTDVRVPGLQRDRELIVRHQEPVRRALGDDRAGTRVRYTLTSLVVGDHALFTNALRVTQADGAELTAPLPAVTLRVVSTLRGTDDSPRDIKGLADWPASIPRWIPALLVIAVLALLLGLLARKFLLRPRILLKNSPPLPPHEVALRALQALREKKFIERGEVEPFYLELSRIVRRYLEGRFTLRAPERTTEEFIREAATSRRLSREHQELTAAFLEQSDLVKFARFRPAAADMEAAWDAAERLVRETRPVAPQEAVAAAR